ncbi:hypothetical protein [Reticulibacter mediterranei]|uniref:hypothetical protein n=1 Tax=Reticulibacter mediterranei TaxID=2778369 RepID=UPI001C68BA3D|nr:hypothetical protein [Reticulibacter mediterranei]
MPKNQHALDTQIALNSLARVIDPPQARPLVVAAVNRHTREAQLPIFYLLIT